MNTENILEEVENMVKKNWMARLVDSTDNTVSPSTVFMFIITLIGLILLLVPAIVLLLEVYYNHTISTDLSGMASYITAVATLFATAGITKAWSTWSTYKYNAQTPQTNESQSSDDKTFEELKE